MGIRLSIDKVKEKCLIYGVKYISGKYNNFDSKIIVKCKCGNDFETTLRTAKNAMKYKKGFSCSNCTIVYLSERFRRPFEEVKQDFELNGCILITKASEYENSWSRLKYIAKCGHENETSYTSFKNSKNYLCSDCIKQINAKENAYNWKGGIYNTESEAFRKTYAFKKWRKDVFVRDHYTCQCCGKISSKLNAHHLDGYNWCVDKRVDVDNGITLCKECHLEFHSLYGQGDNNRKQFEDYLTLDMGIHDIVFN